jgi:hypothetical protein
VNKVSFTTPQTTALVAMCQILSKIHSTDALEPILWLGAVKDPDHPLTELLDPRTPIQRLDIEVYIENNPDKLVKVQMDVQRTLSDSGIGKWVPVYGIVLFWNQQEYVLAYHCAYALESYDLILDGPIFGYPYSDFKSVNSAV